MANGVNDDDYYSRLARARFDAADPDQAEVDTLTAGMRKRENLTRLEDAADTMAWVDPTPLSDLVSTGAALTSAYDRDADMGEMATIGGIGLGASMIPFISPRALKMLKKHGDTEYADEARKVLREYSAKLDAKEIGEAEAKALLQPLMDDYAKAAGLEAKYGLGPQAKTSTIRGGQEEALWQGGEGSGKFTQGWSPEQTGSARTGRVKTDTSGKREMTQRDRAIHEQYGETHPEGAFAQQERGYKTTDPSAEVFSEQIAPGTDFAGSGMASDLSDRELTGKMRGSTALTRPKSYARKPSQQQIADESAQARRAAAGKGTPPESKKQATERGQRRSETATNRARRQAELEQATLSDRLRQQHVIRGKSAPWNDVEIAFLGHKEGVELNQAKKFLSDLKDDGQKVVRGPDGGFSVEDI